MEKRVDGRNDGRGESLAGQAEAGKVLGWRCCFGVQSAAARQTESRAWQGRAGLVAGCHGHGRPWNRGLPGWSRQEQAGKRRPADGDSALPPFRRHPKCPPSRGFTMQHHDYRPAPRAIERLGTRKKARLGLLQLSRTCKSRPVKELINGGSVVVFRLCARILINLLEFERGEPHF
jgi:hypothetical protein